MSQASQPAVRAGHVAFELERFELTGDGRCELEGRWFGVRGRRFMRPALMVIVEGKPTRLLADLEDKPWAAEDGQPWKAAFPFAEGGRDILQAELTVAPDVTVTLAPPVDGPVSGKAKLRPARPERSRGGRRGVRTQSDTRAGERRQGKSQRPAGGPGGSEVESLARQLADAHDRQRDLQRRLEQAEAETAHAANRLDDLLGELSHAVRERDDAQAARDRLAADIEAAEGRRAEALQQSEAARVALDAALADRGAAITAQSRAESERSAATAERDQAVSERDGARALRDHALAERDAALAARDEAVYQRDALSRTSERLQAELAKLVSTSGAAMVMRRAAQEPGASRHHRAPLLAAIGFIAIVAVLLVVLRVA